MVDAQLQEARDGLELAARVAGEQYRLRAQDDPNEAFRKGYAAACEELALVLRAMRKGVPPTFDDFQEARWRALDKIDKEEK
jgi:hypothetical protein